MNSDYDILCKVQQYCQEIVDSYDDGNYCFEDSDYYKGEASVAKEILEMITDK